MLPLVLTLTCAQAWEVAYSPDGDPAHHPEMPVPWRIEFAQGPPDLDVEDERAVLEAAFDTWSMVDGAEIAFTESESGHLVRWVGDWPGEPDEIATTRVRMTDDGEILEFELMLNASFDWSIDGDPSSMDLQNTVTHEIGHALGLIHDRSAPESTMYPYIAFGETKKSTLTADDVAGARYLYGSRPWKGETSSCTGIGPGTLLSSVLALFGAARRARRCRPDRGYVGCPVVN